jgi:hypothetical protein
MPGTGAHGRDIVEREFTRRLRTNIRIQNLSHRRKPVPIAGMRPGFRREDEEGRVALNHPKGI